MEKDELAQEAPASHVGPDHQLPSPRPEPHRSHTVRILIWVLILLLFGLLFWAVLRHQKAAKAPSGRAAMMGGTVTVTAATAKKGDIGVYLNAIGTVTPVYTDLITSQVTGLVSQVHYREGQMVRKGDPLIEIDPRPYQANCCRRRERWSATPTCWRRPEWTSSATRRPGRATPSPSRRWTTRKSWCCRTRARSRTTRGRCSTTRCRLAFCHIDLAHFRPRRSAPGRSGQRGAGQQHHAAGGDHADCSPSPWSSPFRKTIWARC